MRRYDTDHMIAIIRADIDSGKVRTYTAMRTWVWYMMKPDLETSEEIMLAVLDGDLPTMDEIDTEYTRQLARKKIKAKTKRWFG